MERTQLQLDTFLPSMLRLLDEGCTASMARRFNGPNRLTITEWRIVLQLGESPALTASQIVEASGMEKSKVSKAISSLEAAGLLVREVAEEDHRSKTLALTDRGMKVYRSMVPAALNWESELIGGLEPGEYRDLLFLLEKLKMRLKEMA